VRLGGGSVGEEEAQGDLAEELGGAGWTGGGCTTSSLVEMQGAPCAWGGTTAWAKVWKKQKREEIKRREVEKK